MPRATVNVQDTERFELESLPAANGEEAGFVELRRLSYGQVLERRDLGAKVAVEFDRTARRTEDMTMVTEMVQQKVTEYEYKHCIVNHNLEDDKGKLLNFNNPEHIKLLDPRVGAEISQLIDALNDWEADLQGKAENTTFSSESEEALS